MIFPHNQKTSSSSNRTDLAWIANLLGSLVTTSGSTRRSFCHYKMRSGAKLRAAGKGFAGIFCSSPAKSWQGRGCPELGHAACLLGHLSTRGSPSQLYAASRPRSKARGAQMSSHGHPARDGATARVAVPRRPAPRRRGIPRGHPATQKRPNGRCQATTRVPPTTRGAALAALRAGRRCRGHGERCAKAEQ